MTPGLKKSLDTGQVSAGDRLFVEVTLIRPSYKRLGQMTLNVCEALASEE
ncbi:hypothetical protein AB0N14_32145 [Streptomyces sp. NPDC051104]